ncbi:MAG: hypothetical protein FWE49_06690 [Synergistaceae bacterium]|nr:hypothetical protein [Synergistaceae bacterium]
MNSTTVIAPAMVANTATTTPMGREPVKLLRRIGSTTGFFLNIPFIFLVKNSKL